MSYNPFEAPQSERTVVGVLSGDREDLRKIAVYQKGILVCVLLYLISVFGQFAVPVEAQFAFRVGVGCVGIAGAVFVFLLAIKIHGPLKGILLAILCLVPLIGLFVLLIVNGKATGVLRQNGHKVGLLGADLSRI